MPLISAALSISFAQSKKKREKREKHKVLWFNFIYLLSLSTFPETDTAAHK